MKAKGILALALVLISCVPAFAVQRLPLIEDFTNDQCPPCDAIEDTMNTIFQQLRAQNKAAPFRPHVNWPSECDPMYRADISDMETRINYYGINSVPTFQIDGNERVVGYTNPVTVWYNQMRTRFENAYNTPAAVSISFQDAYRNDNTVFCNFTVSYDEAVEDVGTAQTVYMVVAETNHNYIQGREWYPFRGFTEEDGPAGAVINLANVGDSQSFQRTFRFDDPADPYGCDSLPTASPGSEENENKLNVVVWVQRNAGSWTQRAVLNSNWMLVSTVTTDVAAPSPVGSFQLSQNVPNPFSTPTSIRYSLDKTSPVKLSIFDPSGRLVRELVNGSQAEGSHEAVWNGLDRTGQPVSSGIYYYRLEGTTQSQTRKMTFIR